MDEYKSILDELLPILRNKIGFSQTIFNLWFFDFKLVEMTENKAYFTASTYLRHKVISSKYQDLIKEALTEVIGFEVEVEIGCEFQAVEDFTIPENDEGIRYLTDEEKAQKEKEREAKEKEREEREKTENINALINDTAKKSLVEDYTFDNFIEGESNKFARAACLAVAKEPTTYNPLFIYGHSGLGKTHLLYAVINYIKKHHPSMKIVYRKSEDFINELISSISNGTTAAFKEKYRTADVLLIDDIQFIAGKESTQEEFFHTFSALYESEKQIILTSDRPPKDINPLEDRLRTRFEGGLLADVQPPSFELRTAIIRKKADMMKLDLSPELVDYMAERLQNNIRQIEGVIKRLSAVNAILQKPITKLRIDETISVIDPGNMPDSVVVERILMVVARMYDTSIVDLKSKKKTGNISAARHVAIYMIRNLTGLSLKEIGEIFSRDHTTIIASLEKVALNIKTINGEMSRINAMINEVKNP